METALIVIGSISEVVSMIVCPIIASRKNRSVGGWIVGGLLLGLLGILIVACIKEKDY